MTDQIAPFTVRPGLWDNETKVAEIQEKRHTVILPENDGEPTVLTFCNNCGSAFALMLSGRCAECGW